MAIDPTVERKKKEILFPFNVAYRAMHLTSLAVYCYVILIQFSFPLFFPQRIQQQ
jgi:hypothetical protein